MTREIEIVGTSELDTFQRGDYSLLLIDESAINCRNLRQLQELIASQTRGVVIAMPDYQYVEGLRGFAKVQIMAAITNNIQGVICASYEVAQQELDQGWASVGIVGSASWSQTNVIRRPIENATKLQIQETTDKFDKEMMIRANAVITTSNCWLDPAGVVLVKDGEVLVEACSTNFNDSHCTDIPMHWTDMNLKPGERPLFCDSLHSERMAVSEAARKGISLEGATMYLNKFPCRPCAQTTIAAGVNTIVFEIGSYGLLETADLFEIHGTTLKQVVKD